MFTEGQTLRTPCSLFLSYLLFKLAYSDFKTRRTWLVFQIRQDENTYVRVLPFE